MNSYKQNLKHINLFLDSIENQRRYSKHTIRAYQIDLNQLVDHLGEEIRIIDLNKYDLHEYISLVQKLLLPKLLSLVFSDFSFVFVCFFQ